jgi:two-component system, chemotaxis family, response regulator WspR
MVLPDTGLEGALAIAKRVQELVNRRRIRNPGSSHSGRMTVSQGLATAVPDSRSNAKRIMLEADRALYRAKHAGPGRIADASARLW